MLMNTLISVVNLDGEMASVERLLEYGNLPKESEPTQPEDKELPAEWPSRNATITIKNMNFRYRPELDLTLKNINIKLKPGEHVGIVGRTGAGKSSIVAALCRLAEPEQGSRIEVNGVNTLNLGLTCARGAFSVIP